MLDEISVNEVGTDRMMSHSWVEFYWDGETLDWQQPGESSFYRIICISNEPCAFGNSDALEDDGRVLEGRVALWKFHAEDALKLAGYNTQDFWSKATEDLAKRAIAAGVNSYDLQPLHWAISAENHAVVPVLLQHGIPLSRETLELSLKPSRGRVDLVRLLLEHDADPDWQAHGQAPLTHAIGDQDDELVKVLLLHNAAITIQSWQAAGRSNAEIVDALIASSDTIASGALMAAVEYGDRAIVDALLQAKVTVSDEDLRAALKHGGDLTIVDALLAHNPHVSANTLRTAVKLGELAIVNALLAHNPSIDTKTVHVAFELDDRGILDALLAHNPPVSADTLHDAVELGELAIVNALLAHNPPIRPDSVYSAVQLSDRDILDALLAQDPPISPGALRTAVRLGKHSFVTVLLERNVPVSSPALLSAIELGDLAIFSALLAHNAPVSLDTLHTAIELDELDIVDVLLASGMDANSSIAGYLLLYRAAQSNNLDLVTLLIDHGADINALSAGGWTALEGVAFSNVDQEIIAALLDAGAERRDSCAIARQYKSGPEEALVLLCP